MIGKNKLFQHNKIIKFAIIRQLFNLLTLFWDENDAFKIKEHS